MKNINFINSIGILNYALSKYTMLFLFLGYIQVGYSQKSKIFYVPDSLKTKTYKELFKGLNASNNDTIKEKIYAEAYLNKAKNENDVIRISNGYSQFASIKGKKSMDLAIMYCDSIISLTKNSNHINYPGYGYLMKGICEFNLGYYERALENYLIANKYALKNNNIEQQFYINNSIGELKNLWGNYNEALEIFKSQLPLLRQNKIDFQYPKNFYSQVLFSLTNSYILTKKLDSALIYAKEGIQESLAANNSTQYYSFVGQTGIISYYQNNFKMALDSLNKTLPYLTSYNNFLNYHYYLGHIYWKQNNDEKAFFHFSKADSIYGISQDVVPEVRDIQEFFVNYYKKNNDINNQLKYIDRLLYIDSIIKYNYKNLNETLIKKYDTPILIGEKQHIINTLKQSEKKSSLIIFGLVSIFLIALAFVIWSFKKQRVYKERFEKLLLNNQKESLNKKTVKKSSEELNGISLEIVNSILLALEEFENSNGFLNNDLTLNNLSKAFGTNSNYLSKIINFYKKQNFSSYISDLRIDYCIEQLKTNKTFRKYSIKAISFELGYNNAESFSKDFYKKTGIYPSYFIREFESKKQS
ncbi:MAG: helix-turn-helix domain-containing protein [Lutibacter sp.]|nr:helix-turn-helix domain-containing protein [Lutibacter sp.]